jgi:hypothetical protein
MLTSFAMRRHRTDAPGVLVIVGARQPERKVRFELGK